MRVENMVTHGANATAIVYLQASRVPKTADPFKRAASYERSIIKAFEYRGWRVVVDSFLPDSENPAKLLVSVILSNTQRDDTIRECKRWNVKTAAVRKIAAMVAAAPLLLTYTAI